MATPSTQMIKVSVLHDRDQSRDGETWQRWWTEEMMPRILPFALKHGIDRVELYFTPSSFKKRLQDDHLEHLKSGSPAGWDIAPYDAAVIYCTTDFHNVRNMITDPEWDDTVRKFVEVGSTRQRWM